VSKRKNKIGKRNHIPITNDATAAEIVHKIKSYQVSNTTNSTNQQPTGSLSRTFTTPSYVEDNSNDSPQNETGANYKALYEDEKFNGVYSEINNRTGIVEGKLSIEVEKIKTLIESKFSSFTKWSIGIILIIISIPVGIFYFLLNNQTEKIESSVDLKIEKRMTPIENKISEIVKKDTLNKKIK
jgi:hypothetical protein